MGRNCDDHTKNFSFLLRDGSTAWELAPAYDVTFAHNPQGKWTNQHLMSVNGKFKGFEAADLRAEANRFGIGSANRVIDEVRTAIEGWTHYAQEAEVPQAQMSALQKQFLLLA